MNETHLAVMIMNRTEKYGERTALRYKEGGYWKDISWNAMGEQIRATAKGLLEMDVTTGDMVAIFSQNCPTWTISDYGILTVRGVSVPIYVTSSVKQVEYILNEGEIKIIFVGSQDQYNIVTSIADALPSLKKIIVFDDTVNLQGSAIAMYFNDFLSLGRKSARDAELEERLNAASIDDIATVIYTSGTTGDPKGAILTHSNFFNQFAALDERFNVGINDKSLCFLPLSHAYERTWSYYIFRCGAENNYIANPKDIVVYMPDVKPTCMVSVPRLYEKIYATVYDRLENAPAIKKKIFNWALCMGREYAYKKKDNKFIDPGLRLKHAIADKLVLSNIRAIVGGGRRTSSPREARHYPKKSRNSFLPRDYSSAKDTA